jgi:putative nucleotidyltransferase with HDIG domain
MERDKAFQLLKENLKNKNLVKHCLATESSMIGLAEHFREDKEKWGIAGLMHDIDYELVNMNENLHSKKGSEMLKEAGLDKDIVQAVLSHNEIHGVEPESLMAKALFCVDPLTGLIVANVLVLPSKKIADLKTENILKRFKEKAFARNVNREIIAKCDEYLGLSLEEFVEIVLVSMKKISADLGL